MKSPRPYSSPAGDYAVGYGRPPEHTRFQPGQSGDRNGRPKGSRPIGAVLQDVLQQKIPVTENGKTRRMTTLEVIVRRLKNDALRGDPKAIKSLLSLYERYGEASTAALPLEEMLAEDRAILAHFIGSREEASADGCAALSPGGDDVGAD